MNLFCILGLLLCLYALQAAEGWQDAGRHLPGRKGKMKTAPTSGVLFTKQGHRCAWEITGRGGKTTHLLISCAHDGVQYHCRYSGQPGLCPVYTASPARYWAQVFDRLERKAHACRGGKQLKARICKTASLESHMRLLTKDGPKVQAAVRERATEGERYKGKPAAEAERAEKSRRLSEEQRGDVAAVNGGKPQSDTDPTEHYCSEGWHTVCSFFIKFFDG